MKKILILGVHPDDSVISFGGLMHREIKQGHYVKEICFTAGGPSSNVSKQIRRDEHINAMKYLGVDTKILECEDGRLDQVPSCELTKVIDTFIDSIKPDEVYCSPNSIHSDHMALAKAFKASARLKSGFMPRLFCFGTYQFSDQLTSYPDGGLMFQPLSDEDFDAKCNAFKFYKSQFKPSPSPLGLDGLEFMARYQGMLCGHKYAEMYYQLRYIREI